MDISGEIKSAQYVYYPTAFVVDHLWYNRELVKPDEIRYYNDLLSPKRKGKIGLFEPRQGGAGVAICSFLWISKGRNPKKLMEHQPPLGDRRVVACALARGEIAVRTGVTYYNFLPYFNVGLPVNPLPKPKEGTYATSGNRGPVILKQPPHPNAAKVFVNWFLSKEGKEVYYFMIKGLGMLCGSWMSIRPR